MAGVLGKFAAMQVTDVIPGHGSPANMTQVTKYTKGYLEYLRERVSELIEARGDLQQANSIDQSPFAHLDTFDELAARNAGYVFQEVEFE